jgi:hypothetical protein
MTELQEQQAHQPALSGPLFSWLCAGPVQMPRARDSLPTLRNYLLLWPTRSIEVCAGEVRVSEDRVGELREVEVRIGQVRVVEERPSEVRDEELRSAEVRADEERLGEVRVGEVRVGEVRVRQIDRVVRSVVSGTSTPNDSHSRLYVRAQPALRGLRAWLTIGPRLPLLVRALADERSQDFHHRGVVPGRVTGDAFQRVDAADAYVEFCGAKLLDRLRVALGHLAFPR